MKIYHNPRCAKSRQTLALLQENGVEPEVVLYLKTIPTVEALKSLVSKLGIRPLQLIRKAFVR
jgi:arsenate reductase